MSSTLPTKAFLRLKYIKKAGLEKFQSSLRQNSNENILIRMAAAAIKLHESRSHNASSPLVHASSTMSSQSDKLTTLLNSLWSTERLVAEKTNPVFIHPSVTQYKPLLHNTITIQKDSEMNKHTLESTYSSFMDYFSKLSFPSLEELIEKTHKLELDPSVKSFFTMCPPPDMANSLPVVHDGKTSGYQLKPWVTLNGFQYSTGIKINNVLDVLPPEIRNHVELSGVLHLTHQIFICNEFNLKYKLPKETLSSYKPTFKVNKKIKPIKKLDNIRPPIVTVMGHVDHGKTTLLDSLRNSNVAKQEIGGITQKVGAFQVTLGEGELKKVCTFIDTPGHAAFMNMRRRGIQLSDTIVLVIAGDDGVKEQTVECINLAKEYNLPVVVAVTKCDRDTFDITESLQRISQQLVQYDIQTEVLGGTTMIVPVGSLKKMGFDDLLTAIDIQTEDSNRKCDPRRLAEAVVLESHIDQKSGASMDIIVRNGTLHVGDVGVVGTEYGHIRTIYMDGKYVKEAKPGSPVRIAGIDYPNAAGEQLLIQVNEDKAKALVDERKEKLQKNNIENETQKSSSQIHEKKHETIEKETEKVEEPTEELLAKEYNQPKLKTSDGREIFTIVIKSDLQGSIDALKNEINKIRAEEIDIQIIDAGTGALAMKDITTASISRAIIIAFNIPISNIMKQIAEGSNIKIIKEKVIYKALDQIKDILKTKLPDKYERVLVGKAYVKRVFDIGVKGNRTMKVAGTECTEGKITPNSFVTITRGGKIIEENVRISSLKLFKKEVEQIDQGQECGIGFQGFNGVAESDELIIFEDVKIKDRIERSKNEVDVVVENESEIKKY